MRKIIQKFVEYPVYANIVIAIVVLLGVFSYSSMNKSFFPETESRIISISVFYPGAAPVEMEEGVTSRIEEAVRGLIGIKEINSTSVENRSTVSIETTGEYPIDEILLEVKNAVDGISSLPSAAERPIVSKQRSRAFAMFLTLSAAEGRDISLMALKEHGQRVEEDFLNSGVISQVSLSGFPQPEISVEVAEQQLLRHSLSFDDIINAIRNNNQDVSGGEIKSADEELLIRLRSRSTDTDKLGNIIVGAREDGGFLRINDIGTVKKTFADTPNESFVNGNPAASIRIEKLPEEDLQEITEFVTDYIMAFNGKDQGVEIIVSRSFYEILMSRLRLLTGNGMIGLVLVVISLSLFLNTRLSFWVSFGIPFSFLGMFILAGFNGITINMISLMGMLLVIGILVDDGIVVAENIFVHFEEGKSPMRAAVDGTMEVLPAVLTSVTTTMVAFTPLLFLAGTNMEMMTQLSLVVIFALFFSLIEAFLILPAHLGNRKVLNRERLKKRNTGFKKYFEGFIIWMRDDIYHYVIKWLIKWRHAVIGIPVALFLITAGLFIGGHIKNTFFPAVDFDNFSVNIAFTPGDGVAHTRDVLNDFEEAVWEVNEALKKELDFDGDIIETVNKNIGTAFRGQESGSHAGSLGIYPRDLEGMPLTGFDIANRVRMKIGPVPEARKFTVGGRNRWGSPVSVGLMSKNLEELELAKDYLMVRLEELPQLKDINENIALGKQEVRLDLKPKAYFLGLNEASIAQQVRQGFYGGQAQRLQEGRDELRVWVRYPKTDRLSLGQMENMKIKTASGEYPLVELTDYHLERGPVSIKRFNGSREIRVEAETVDPYAPVPEILEQIEADILPDVISQFPGVRYMFQGQSKSSNEAMSKAVYYFGLAFIVIIMLLIILFRSTSKVLIILFMIPLSMLGVFWGHGIHGQPLSIMSLWGMVALTGVIINDAIVFLTKYDGLLLNGKSVTEAIIGAGKSRLRPILLTSFTTTIGLFPLILEQSRQAQFLVPMAISLAYGVAIGTVFILIFFPVLIMLLNDFNVFIRKIWTGVAPEKEDVEAVIIQYRRRKDYEKNNEEDLITEV
ncbi:MAG: efflux RND transporter permease subunit [Bacteroidota bacterium]